ncbi:MAG TPA: hypothetical protein VN969_22175 [Streptosporangiaceae bacterium]|jgi:hypothetical protein|nr:hypothetical protein [Streptosporangiaceae bacterium]
MAFLAAAAGLLVGVLLAVTWTAGCRQGRRDVLSAAHALQQSEGDPRLPG